VYDGIVSARPDSGTVQASWSVRLARTPGVDSVVLLLNSGVILTSLTGRDVQRFETTVERGPALLAQLESRVGSALMDSLLTRFMTEPLRTTPSVLDMIERTVGPEQGAWFRSEVGR
jgi:hypothetical protein